MVAEAEAVIERVRGGAAMSDVDDRTDRHDRRDLTAHIDAGVGDDIVPALFEYIAIPNVSEAFDPEWDEHGHMQPRRRADPRLVRGAHDRRA